MNAASTRNRAWPSCSPQGYWPAQQKVFTVLTGPNNTVARVDVGRGGCYGTANIPGGACGAAAQAASGNALWSPSTASASGRRGERDAKITHLSDAPQYIERLSYIQRADGAESEASAPQVKEIERNRHEYLGEAFGGVADGDAPRAVRGYCGRMRDDKRPLAKLFVLGRLLLRERGELRRNRRLFRRTYGHRVRRR